MPAYSGLTMLAGGLFIIIFADLLRVVNRKVLRDSDEPGRIESHEKDRRCPSPKKKLKFIEIEQR